MVDIVAFKTGKKSAKTGKKIAGIKIADFCRCSFFCLYKKHTKKKKKNIIAFKHHPPLPLQNWAIFLFFVNMKGVL